MAEEVNLVGERLEIIEVIDFPQSNYVKTVGLDSERHEVNNLWPKAKRRVLEIYDDEYEQEIVYELIRSLVIIAHEVDDTEIHYVMHR